MFQQITKAASAALNSIQTQGQNFDNTNTILNNYQFGGSSGSTSKLPVKHENQTSNRQNNQIQGGSDYDTSTSQQQQYQYCNSSCKNNYQHGNAKLKLDSDSEVPSTLPQSNYRQNDWQYSKLNQQSLKEIFLPFSWGRFRGKWDTRIGDLNRDSKKILNLNAIQCEELHQDKNSELPAGAVDLRRISLTKPGYKMRKKTTGRYTEQLNKVDQLNQGNKSDSDMLLGPSMISSTQSQSSDSASKSDQSQSDSTKTQSPQQTKSSSSSKQSESDSSDSDPRQHTGTGSLERRPSADIAMRRRNIVRENRQSFLSIYEVPSGAGSMLGEGAFGTVIRCKHRTTNITRAAKKIPKIALEDHKQFENEVENLMKLDHPHIVKLVEYFEEEEMYVLIFEMCNGPDLFDRIVDVISKQCCFDEIEGGRLLRHMLKAILCCHSHNIIHRDIKPENFMFSRVDPKSSLKMIDLGLSELYQYNTNTSSQNSQQQTVSNSDYSTGDSSEEQGNHSPTPVGTIAYMSPEMLLGKKYDKQCDIWSLGVILWACLVGEPLFTHECDKLCKTQILDEGFLEIELKKLVGKVSPQARDLLTKMLKRNPSDRITASDALKHEFIMKSYSPSDYSALGKGPALFDKDIVRKMELYAKMPALKRVGLYIFAHLCGTDGDDMRLYRVTFRQLDHSGLGALTPQEMTKAIRAKGLQVPQDFETRVLSLLDSDKSQSIDFLEFLAATIEIKKNSSKHEKILKGVFQLMDTKRRGYIDSHDMAEIFSGNSEQQLKDMILEVSEKGSSSSSLSESDSKLFWDEFKALMLRTEKMG